MRVFSKNTFISGITLFLLTNLFAQAPDTLWTKTYGGTSTDVGRAVQQTSDGGYIIAGETSSFSAVMFDVFLIKTDSLGDTLWTKIFGGDSSEAIYSVKQTSDGGYVIAGNTRSFGPSADVYIVKTDSLGDSLWTRVYGGAYTEGCYSVQQTYNRGYILVGYTKSFGLYPYPNVYLVRIDSLGDTLWTKTYGGTLGDRGYSVQQTSDKGYIIVGDTYSFGVGDGDVYVIKTDSLGDTLWTKTIGGLNHDEGRSIQQISGGNYIITGWTYSFGPNDADVYLIKIDTLGNILWTRTYGGYTSDCAYSVKQTIDGGYVIAGYTQSFGVGASDFYIIKTDSLGDTLWTDTYGGANYDDAFSVQQTSDKGYIITGFTESFGAGGPDVWLIKTEPDVGIVEEKITPIKSNNFGATIFSGPLLLPEGKKCKVFDITGRTVVPDKIKPGIYFIEVDGVITQKVVKVR